MRSLISLAFLLLALPSYADENTDQKVRDALQGDIRTEAEIARDQNRKPVETLAFFGLKDDMKVLELLPGGGWYTKLLAPVLRDKGEVYVAIGTNNVVTNLIPQAGFGHIKALDIGVDLMRTGEFGTNNIPPFDFGVKGLDMVVTFRNMHNFTPEGRANINNAVYKSLSKGGLYGVIDHSRRHMEPMTAENRRRADVVEIIKEVQAAGFDLVDYSDLHYRPDDELRYEVGRHSVTGNTDRFTLLFKKR